MGDTGGEGTPTSTSILFPIPMSQSVYVTPTCSFLHPQHANYNTLYSQSQSDLFLPSTSRDYCNINLTHITYMNQMNQAQKQAADQEKKEQMEEMKQSMLSQILSPEAKDRLSKIKLVKPDKAQMIENSLIQVAQSGRLQSRISEAQLVDMLEKESDKKAESKITFTRRGLDDDW